MTEQGRTLAMEGVYVSNGRVPAAMKGRDRALRSLSNKQETLLQAQSDEDAL